MGGDYDDEVFHYAELAGILAGEGHVDLRITDDLDVLHPSELTRYQAIANWSTFVEPTEAQVSALLDCVGQGCGFLALHGATATFWNSVPYLTMIGSRFVDHQPLRRFTVHIDDPTHPVTAGIEDFEIEDELYEVSSNEAEYQTLVSAMVEGRSRRDAIDAANDVGRSPLQEGTHILASAEGQHVLYVKKFG